MNGEFHLHITSFHCALELATDPRQEQSREISVGDLSWVRLYVPGESWVDSQFSQQLSSSALLIRLESAGLNTQGFQYSNTQCSEQCTQQGFQYYNTRLDYSTSAPTHFRTLSIFNVDQMCTPVCILKNNNLSHAFWFKNLCF